LGGVKFCKLTSKNKNHRLSKYQLSYENINFHPILESPIHWMPSKYPKAGFAASNFLNKIYLHIF